MTVNSTSKIVFLGGTSGLGLAAARAAAEAGAQVFIGSRNPESVARALAELPDSVTGHVVNAADSSSVAAFFDAVGEFDHFAYTAAENLSSVTLADFTPEKAASFFGLRLFHALDAVRLAVPHLRAGGSITLTSGTAAYRGGPGWLLGSATSGATISAVRSLAVELAPLRVNAVAPGIVRSPLWDSMSAADREAMYADAAKRLPAGRVPEPSDVARVYLGLMDQDFVTGTVSVVDGGTLIV
ncbi:SDR family oxidoreductase [Mycetocola tolaasinivorans]|uniref:SDR family oxidoreductase n=1 Tax=Mycetocola tolaasinivorans TaxID=76635 RepID=A0A3L7A4D8_9MICO|nr:SDR family oxidoreductase [Mycetocola tolaasinivorans]RLP74925.1 SDR family oxidoreductase [Mycetocola tolaasinivorans]